VAHESECKIVGRTHFMLVNVCGRRWKALQLAIFTLYIDDSGTSPSQPVAIATALIIPAKQIVRLENQWNGIRKKYGFNIFHTSEFVARNPKSEFADWGEQKQEQLFFRVRQISKKYGVRAVSIAVNKQDYYEIVPQAYRNYIGKEHYTWAIRQLIANLDTLHKARPREWVFQWMGGPRDDRRIEIETLMEQQQWLMNKNGEEGDYLNYTFQKSEGIPGLQCVDGIGWVCYRFALFAMRKTPLHKFAQVGWHDLEGDRGKNGWMHAVAIRRENLQKSITKALADGTAMEFFTEWEKDKKKQRD
jgi:hypothetical protein